MLSQSCIFDKCAKALLVTETKYTPHFTTLIAVPRIVKCFCELALAEYESFLHDFEIRLLARVSLKYQGCSTPKKFAIIRAIADRLGYSVDGGAA